MAVVYSVSLSVFKASVCSLFLSPLPLLEPFLVSLLPLLLLPSQIRSMAALLLALFCRVSITLTMVSGFGFQLACLLEAKRYGQSANLWISPHIHGLFSF